MAVEELREWCSFTECVNVYGIVYCAEMARVGLKYMKVHTVYVVYD